MVSQRTSEKNALRRKYLPNTTISRNDTFDIGRFASLFKVGESARKLDRCKLYYLLKNKINGNHIIILFI